MHGGVVGRAFRAIFLFGVLILSSAFQRHPGIFLLPGRSTLRSVERSATPDPFRPPRHPLEPICINILQRALYGKDDLDTLLLSTKRLRVGPLEAHAEEGEFLDAKEWEIVERQVRDVVASRSNLEAALVAATSNFPWIEKYRAGSDFGLPLDGVASALTIVNR